MVREAPRQVRAWFRAHPLAADTVFAIALTVCTVAFMINGPWALRQPQVPPAAFAIVSFSCLSVALRRKAPLSALLISGAADVALGAMHITGTFADFAPLINLYSLTAYRGLALSVVGLGVSAIAYLSQVAFIPRPVGLFDHLFVGVVIGAVWLLGRSVRLRRAYYAELEGRAERLDRARVADARAAVAEERSRIARELHDVVAHHVSVMTVQAAAARKVLAANPEGAREAMGAIEEMGRTALAEMRSIVGVLRTDAETDAEQPADRAPQPGVRDVGALVQQMRDAGLRTQLWIEGEQRVLPPGIDLAAFRLIQEALTNSLTHAGPAARAWVTVRFDDGELTVQVEDDGRGLATALTAGNEKRPGHGLVGIRERVALYGGFLRVGPRPGGGFEVRARFPLTSSTSAQRTANGDQGIAGR